MATPQLLNGQIQVPFVCPVCAGANAVHLITLSRGGGTECGACKRWLRAADVMRAMHSPRAERTEPRREPRAAALPRARIVWPPTAESRAAATPLRRQS